MIDFSIKSYKNLAVNYSEIAKFYKTDDKEDLIKLVDSALIDLEKDIDFQVIYKVLPVNICGDKIDFGSFSVKSKSLSKNLSGAKTAVLFLATIGIGIDRKIKKYSVLEPSKSLLYQAIGTERVETLCNEFCEDLKKEFCKVNTRFSAGYGDLPLETQKDIFKVLNPSRIGVSLSEGLLMTPSKSVTAFVGINTDNLSELNSCNNCDKKDCEYRKK